MSGYFKQRTLHRQLNMEEKIAARTQTFSLRKRSRTVLNFCWKVRWSTSGNHNLFLPKCHGGLKIITISGIRCLDYPICFRFIDRWFCDMGECAHPLTIGVLMLAGSKTRFIYFVMTRLATSITSLRSCDSGYFIPEHFLCGDACLWLNFYMSNYNVPVPHSLDPAKR